MAVLVLSMTGVVYANWCDNIYINHTVKFGTVKVGIVNIGVNDPPGSDDTTVYPLFQNDGFATLSVGQDGWFPYTTYRWDKDVANVTSENIDEVGTAQCPESYSMYYDKVRFNVTGAYPWYLAEEHFQIVNLGTIPVFIQNITVVSVNDPDDILDSIEVWWQVTSPDGVVQGVNSPERLATLLKSIQLDECQFIDIWLRIVFLQSLPQDATATFEINFAAAQWNEVAFYPRPAS